MASRLTTFGNDLYTGKRSFNFVGGRRKWYVIAAVLVILSIAVPLVRGVNFSIEFLGGSQFQITSVQNATAEPATKAVESVVPDATAKVTIVGDSGVRVQTDQLSQQDSHDVSAALAEAYDVPVSEVTSSFIGPSWAPTSRGRRSSVSSPSCCSPASSWRSTSARGRCRSPRSSRWSAT